MDVSFRNAKFICGFATVPENMIRCWEPLSIRFSDGTEDKATRVISLQTLSGVGDIRIPFAALLSSILTPSHFRPPVGQKRRTCSVFSPSSLFQSPVGSSGEIPERA
jgi:hypothetical protein